MKLAAWFVVAGIGVALMIGVYRSERDAGGVTPISSGMIVAVRSTQQTFDGPIPFPSIRAGVTHLPASGISAMVAMSASGNAERMRSLQFRISEKVIQVALKKVGIDQSTLAWGKLPRVGADEVLAGADVSRRERIHVGETSYTVTGGLPRTAGLLARCYVLPAEERSGEHDEERDAAFQSALLIPLDANQLADRAVVKQLADRFPAKEFNRMACLPVIGPLGFYLTLLGEAIFLLGGSGVLISLYAAASRLRLGILRDPLAALTTHRRLNWTVHVGYFSLYLLAALLVFRAPDLRNALQAIIQSDISEGGGLLQKAGSAYRSGNVAWAALVTFGINFFVGSVLVLTLPSCVIPGSGILVAGFRAVLWGLILVPATLQQAFVMLPHSGTLLLEGEGYILAAFFGLMVPLSLRRRPADSDSAVPRGYRWAVLLNLKGCVLVAIVLAVAATYEATEVIAMLRAG
ncbi:MAG TPA: hypothetical protein VHX68_07430 [Planctomycetaceae bacterium]|jgi:hypothetical protein|nr:hypothetical protein [Planctomycetaceae bacterium]